ncbi:DUF5050 domain-containing protein [Bacillus marinisedimentorum]|uniref:DUF5050 domain-containing protein n=1 Tax=Bacillus marinisedimentorum TaxID=1821260 RepID=UPI0007DEEB3E|nr:DUF5050 domain-containing protein [Bacillus marinisedimentorum]
MNKIKKGFNRFSLVALLLISTLFMPTFPSIGENGKAYAAEINRISGSSRFQTAVSISQTGWQNTENVVLANGFNFPDALSGTPLSYALDAPILLVNEDRIPQSTLDEIKRLGPKNIYLLGGTSVINDNVFNELKGKGYQVIRVAGSSRYNTAMEIGKELRKINSQDTAVLVYGDNYPDALGVGGISSEKGWPILFTESDTLHNATKKALDNWGIKKVFIVGGTAVIKGAVAQEIKDMGISVERIAGSGRIETSIKVAEKFYPATDGAVISTGFNFPDALSGGPLAGKLSRPIILVNPDRASQKVLDYIDSAKANTLTILGGTSAVKDNVKNDISSLYVGNSVGNIINGGVVAQDGDWIYSINYDSIYKVKTDGTNKTKITSDLAEYINVTDGWIYYSNISDGRTTYKIKTDGTNKTKLSGTSGSYMNVIGDWIYYINYREGNKGIFKVKTDGTNLSKIKEGYFTELNVVNDWMYFVDTTGVDNRLYKMKTDGSSLTEIYNGHFTDINVVGDMIYYIDQFENSSIFKMKTNGSNRTKITNVTSNRLNVSGEWIYFRNGDDHNKIYKIRTNGTGKAKVNNDIWSREINIVGDWIYYKVSVSEGDHLYRIKTDGTQRELIAKNLIIESN